MDLLQLFKVSEYWLTQLSRYCGKLVILTLFWSSFLSLIHLTANALGYADLLGGLFKITHSIYGDKVAWASTSIALATSVAFGHIRNLELNEEKRTEEQKEKWETEFYKRNGIDPESRKNK